ncbi:hypothetical protein ARMGADRAFT_729991 [Armillaria gallica]|uniref:Uncharacterized protein n=1 Tax=Armillaria gallica TaxID=47427 RepID=A0A2H3CU32_ARMGA|nr:hypothetical protein ARMGADRAFT_729991 [Armillaria gallica]
MFPRSQGICQRTRSQILAPRRRGKNFGRNDVESVLGYLRVERWPRSISRINRSHPKARPRLLLRRLLWPSRNRNCYCDNVSSIFSVSFSVAILPRSFKNPCIKLSSCTSANRKYARTNVCPGPWLTQSGHRKVANSMSSSFPTTNPASARHLTRLLWFPASMSQSSGGGRRRIFTQIREKGNHFLSRYQPRQDAH